MFKSALKRLSHGISASAGDLEQDAASLLLQEQHDGTETPVASGHASVEVLGAWGQTTNPARTRDGGGAEVPRFAKPFLYTPSKPLSTTALPVSPSTSRPGTAIPPRLLIISTASSRRDAESSKETWLDLQEGSTRIGRDEECQVRLVWQGVQGLHVLLEVARGTHGASSVCKADNASYAVSEGVRVGSVKEDIRSFEFSRHARLICKPSGRCG